MRTPKNVLGETLEACCFQPQTGFYRDGYCKTGQGDDGVHVVCAVMTAEFLKYSAEQGNDLTTPHPEHEFPGLVADDRWCLCVTRWRDAFEAGCAPAVILEATHMSALEFVDLDQLRQLAVK